MSEEEPSRDANPWFYELVDHLCNGTYVLRAVPCTWTRYEEFYKSHPEILESNPDLISGIRGKCGKGPFWLVEISIPELYQWNNKRLGEVVVHGDARKSGEGQASMVRLPGVISLLFDAEHVEHHFVGGKYHYDIESRENLRLGELLTCEWSPPTPQQVERRKMETTDSIS